MFPTTVNLPCLGRKETKKARLWGGRFRTDTDPVMEKFNDSLRFDKCMWAEDIAGSEAYAKALERSGILTQSESSKICEGLQKVHAEWAAGKFEVVVSPPAYSHITKLEENTNDRAMVDTPPELGV